MKAILFKKRFYLGLFLGLGILASLATDRDRLWAISKNMQIFAEVYRAVNADYVEKTDPNALMRTAIDSMLHRMDPYTNFFSEAQMERLRMDVRGAWDGIGIELIRYGKDKIAVGEVLEGYAAEKAGLKAGDILLEVEGAKITNQGVDEVEKTLNGKAGTQVRLKVLRPLEKKEYEWTLMREKIVRKNVPHYTMLDEQTGYIILTTFTEQAGENVAKALRELQETKNPKQIILDLRDNGGGLLMEAVNLCNVFIPKGKDIVSTSSKVASWDRAYLTLNNPLDTRIPLIVLINERSASASEIVAGAIQDYDRGVLVGRKSFGKGLVQNTKDIGYNSKMKLTTAKYYIPSGRCIQALEYSDGQSKAIADSLKKTFKTAAGRIVPDGGGLYPDEAVAKEPESVILKSLREQHVIFDFANRYRAEHDSIAPADKFKLSDADFERFVKFVTENNYEYDTESERLLAKLKVQVETDKSEPERWQAVLGRLKAKLLEDKRRDIYKHKAEIMLHLTEEIVSRYYFEKGKIQVRLQNDPDIQAAQKLFANTERFAKLLKP